MTLVYENINEVHILFLRAKGFVFIDTKTEYEKQRLENQGVTCIWYNSGKLVIQGKEERLDKIINLLKSQNVSPKQSKEKIIEDKNYDFNSKKHIGSDETLKGDTFGGLIVCAFLYEPKIEGELVFLGVKDSKKLSDKKIIEMAQIILKKYSDRISMYELNPKEYNEEIKNNSITQILNKAHKKIAKKLNDSVFHVVDKYPGCVCGDKQITKGEEQSLAIAAASIVARYLALEQFGYLSALVGFTLPKGSTHVKWALEELVKKGEDLSQFAKLHFQNVQLVLGNPK